MNGIVPLVSQFALVEMLPHLSSDSLVLAGALVAATQLGDHA